MSATAVIQGAARPAGVDAVITARLRGSLTLADRNIFTDVYFGRYSKCLAAALTRGTYGTGTRAGCVVTESTIDVMEGGTAQLTIRWEPGGPSASAALLPNDDFDISIIELNPKIERHPFFNGANQHSTSLDAEWISLAYQAVFGPTPQQREDAKTDLAGDLSYESALAIVLMNKWAMGQDTYYLAGVQYTWIWHSFALPTVSAGGVISEPLGPLYGYFSGLEWLRKADILKPKGVNGSCYEVQSCWVGAPVGHWDSDLYPSA